MGIMQKIISFFNSDTGNIKTVYLKLLTIDLKLTTQKASYESVSALNIARLKILNFIFKICNENENIFSKEKYL